MEAPGVEPGRAKDRLERFREVSRESDCSTTRETANEDRYAGVVMAHAITREQVVEWLRAEGDLLLAAGRAEAAAMMDRAAAILNSNSQER